MEPVIDWEQRYRNAATAWERDQLNPAFIQWRAQFSTKPGRVVLPGCGRAPEVLAFAELGWRVAALDLAETAVRYQREVLSEAGFEVSAVATNIFHWQPDEPVDLVYEQTCLCALSPAQWVSYEQCLFSWLRPGGVLAALFMQTGKEGGPPFHCDIEAMRELFTARRWAWSEQSIRSEHPMGIHEVGFFLTRLE